MYTIKEKPEDFIVREISNVEINATGKFSYFKLTKRNWNTLDVVKEIAKRLHLKVGQIGFAGTKDRTAVTEQLISLPDNKRVSDLKIKDVELAFVGKGDKPISLGDLEGNAFEIIVHSTEKIKKVKKIPNYFDEQRFSKCNKDIGKAIIKKDFIQAAALIDDALVAEYLQRNPNDGVGALKRLPIRLLKLFVMAYQSWMWNELAGAYLKQNKVMKVLPYSLGKFVFAQGDNLKIPLLGFSTEEYPHLSPIINEILTREDLELTDFIVKQIPELSLEGGERDLFVEVKSLEIKGDLISFTLPKGSYATMVVRAMAG